MTAGTTTHEVMAPPKLSIETGDVPRTAHQQLFSFPKPPTDRKTPTSPLFHLQIDTDSRKESSGFGSPTSTTSSPSFQTFLQARPSTSHSDGNPRVVASSELVFREVQPPLSPSEAPRTVQPDENFGQVKIHAKSDLGKPLPTRPLDDYSEETRNAVPTSSEVPQIPPQERTKEPPVPVPRALPSHTVPLFLFLRDEAFSERIAVEGLMEWVDFHVKQGVRVRGLSRDLDIVKSEVRFSLIRSDFFLHVQILSSSCYPQLVKSLQESSLSSETRKAKLTSIDEIFSSSDITNRVPPGLHRLPPLLTDEQFRNLDEIIVVDCLVRINANLTTQIVADINRDGHQTDPRAGKAKQKRHSLQRYTSFRAKGDIASSTEERASNSDSPKARRILGLDAASTSPKGQLPQESIRPHESAINSSPALFPQKRSFSYRNLRDISKEQPNRSDMQRSNSLSGARSLFGVLLGTDHRETTPLPKSGRAEKVLRGVMGLFGPKSSRNHARTDPEHLIDGRDHTRSVPSEVKRSGIPPTSRASVDTALLRNTQANVPAGRNTTATSRHLDATSASASFAHLVQRGNKACTMTEGIRTASSPSVMAEQILEVLLEFINYKLFPTFDHAKAALGPTDVGGKRLIALIQSLNRISFDTRFKVRELPLDIRQFLS